MTTQGDAIVIGAGHNGLVCAAYLARAGLNVRVVERREIVGGAAVTEEIVPGYRFSRAAYVNSLLRPQILRELELHRHGLEFLPRNPSSFTPTDDASSYLFLGPETAENVRQIAKFSRRDAEAFPRYEAMLDRFARCLEASLDRAPPDLAVSSWKERLASLAALTRLGWRVLRLGRELPSFTEFFTAPARRLLERWFESEPLRGTLATDAIIGSTASPSTPGSGYVLFHHVMGESDGARGVWSYVRGGMGALSGAIASAARRAGARIELGCPVRRILTATEDGAPRAEGVVLEDGSELRARCVLSSADPRVTFRSLLDDGDLPPEFRERIDHLDFSSAVTKINVAVDRLPSFLALKSDRVGPQHRGTIHLVSTLDAIETAHREALEGRCSRRPVIEMTIPSALDPSLAPPGHHVISLFVQYTPYELAGSSWDEDGVRESFADRVFAVIEDYAPGFTASVVGRDILCPRDLERIFALSGGNIFHGAMGLDQLFWSRPAPGWSRYRTPVSGLYLCGAGAHPGGGVLGAPGRNAARVALRDLSGVRPGADQLAPQDSASSVGSGPTSG